MQHTQTVKWNQILWC